MEEKQSWQGDIVETTAAGELRSGGGGKKSGKPATGAEQQEWGIQVGPFCFCNSVHPFRLRGTGRQSRGRPPLTSRLRSPTLWHVFRMATSMSSVASLAWTDCCSGETETRQREWSTRHNMVIPSHAQNLHCYLKVSDNASERDWNGKLCWSSNSLGSTVQLHLTLVMYRKRVNSLKHPILCNLNEMI